MRSDERAYPHNSKKTDSKYREYQMIVGAICNEWQDAKKGAGWKWTVSMNGMLCVNVDDMICMQGPCGFNWRYAGMNAADTRMDDRV
jgi:hypothetical protein